MTTARISRNSPCPCGSGKKYKKCCLSLSTSTPRFSWPPVSQLSPTSPRTTSFPQAMIRSSASAMKWNEVVFDALHDGGRLHAVLLYSDGGLNAGLIRKDEIVTLDLPDVGFRGPATVVAIARASSQGDVEAEVVRVVQFRDEDDLGKALYGDWNPPRDFVERWANRRRMISLRMDFPDGRSCEIELLRTVRWMEQNSVQVGGAVFLDLSHVGVRGWASVLEIHSCPPPEESGEGEMVTGTFKYSHGRVGELVLESEPKPISVTPSHLFWSEDRQTWVQVSQLHPGETVRTMDGLTRVVSFTMTDRVEPVCNLEVAYDHVYRVGESGVLVHNQSAPPARQWPKCNKIPPTGAARDYQIRACGSMEYEVSGGGAKKCADAVEGTVVVDCKALTNPNSSPQTGTAPDFVTLSYREKELAGLKVYEQIISDPCSGLTSLKIRVQDANQVSFWKTLLSNLSISTSVEVSP